LSSLLTKLKQGNDLLTPIFFLIRLP